MRVMVRRHDTNVLLVALAGLIAAMLLAAAPARGGSADPRVASKVSPTSIDQSAEDFARTALHTDGFGRRAKPKRPLWYKSARIRRNIRGIHPHGIPRYKSRQQNLQ